MPDPNQTILCELNRQEYLKRHKQVKFSILVKIEIKISNSKTDLKQILFCNVRCIKQCQNFVLVYHQQRNVSMFIRIFFIILKIAFYDMI